MDSSRIDAALQSVKRLAIQSDEAGRQQLTNSLRQLIHSLEGTEDTILRYGSTSLQTAAIKMGYDLGIFERLVASKTPVTVDEIAQDNGAAFELTLQEISANEYTANNTTHNLATKFVEAALNHYFYTVEPQFNALPKFLKRTNYQDPVDDMHTAFHDGWKTSLHPFQWFTTKPEHLAYFNDYMALRREPEYSWLSVYPLNREINNGKNGEVGSDSRAIYVDVGGGIGHQCRQFKEKYPHIPGRVILQDLPHSIANALQTPGVENMEHDFFQLQPIQGAKFYFLRGVLHDFPPPKILSILEQIKAAMTSDSVLLIDEMILPQTGVNLIATTIDMKMLTALAGMERTQVQWRRIFEQAGLELVETFVYDPLGYEAVMDVRLPSTACQ